MSLGENINRLRTERGMNQEELAEALAVSRQSISKWETDASVPELEKLVKLARLFGVTLDELVSGKGPEEEAEPQQAVVERQGAPGHRTAAIVLLCMAFAVALLCTLMGGLLEGLVLCLPFLVCGLVCLWAKKHPGLWCAWALVLMADLYLRYATGLSWAMVRFTFLWEKSWNYTRLVIAWCQLLCGLGLLAVTVVKLGKGPAVAWTKRNRMLLAGGCVLFVLLCLPISGWLFQIGGQGLSLASLVTFVNWLQDVLRLALLAGVGCAVIRGRGSGRGG